MQFQADDNWKIELKHAGCVRQRQAHASGIQTSPEDDDLRAAAADAE
jgi:hypothetical protein